MIRKVILGLFLACALVVSADAAVPASVTVQGKLTDAAGTPLTAGVKSFTFKIFDSPTLGTEIWPNAPGENQSLTSDPAGLWIGLVGAVVPLTDPVFADTVRWLEITVDGTTLPRVRLVTGPYAYRVATVDGASGGTITSKVSIGPGHANTGVNAFVAGETNTASGDWSFVGGSDNLADDTGTVVSGGGNNRARGKYSTVAGGGGSNPIDSNLASATQSTVAGGARNVASAQGAFVGGGFRNTASDNSATVAGGSSNTASGSNAAIGGGFGNVAEGAWATVGGGHKNYALGDHATIAGGGGSTPVDSNLATGAQSTIGGGSRNVASGLVATVGGGFHNRAHGAYSTIGGGGGPFPSDSNVAGGLCATVPGGQENSANANYAFAAGRRAKANHGGTFVWADSTDADFVSTSANQFLIRASGGVGIGTDSPDGPLHVQEGSAGAVSGNASASAIFERSGANYIHILSPDANERGFLFGSPANSLMGGIRFNPSGTEKGFHFRGGNNTVRLILDSLGNLTADGCVVGSNIACLSDARFKRNVETLPNALDVVERLRGVRYEWKTDEFPERDFADGDQVGLIAQEVRELVPQAVIEQSDGYLAVDYARLVPLLIEGMKEQQRQIDELKAALKSMTP